MQKRNVKYYYSRRCDVRGGGKNGGSLCSTLHLREECDWMNIVDNVGGNMYALVEASGKDEVYNLMSKKDEVQFMFNMVAGGKGGINHISKKAGKLLEDKVLLLKARDQLKLACEKKKRDLEQQKRPLDEMESLLNREFGVLVDDLETIRLIYLMRFLIKWKNQQQKRSHLSNK